MNIKSQICCFSGHRPTKLPFGYDETHPSCLRLKAALFGEAGRLREEGVTTFLSGMAQGTDMIAAEIVLDMRRAYPGNNIRLVAVVPYEGQADRWSIEYRERYFNILSKADEVMTLRKRYTDSCMQERNRYMVNASAHLVAVCGGAGGGTRYTVDYAIKKGLEVIIINPDTLKREHIPSPGPLVSFTNRFLR